MALAGKVVIVTGASSGIGEAAARRLAQGGCRVTLAARRCNELERVAGEIEAEGGEALVVPADVRDWPAIERVVRTTLDRWGQIDVLLNNAGLGYSSRVADLDPAQLREQVDVNLVGVIECARAVLPSMIARRSGHIINVASLAGMIGLPGSSVYSATKFAVIGFSDALRREVRGQGIRVTALCLGFVATSFSPRLKRIAETETGKVQEQSGRPAHLPGVMKASYVADRIADVIERPRRQLLLPRGWGLLVRVGQALPWLTDAASARFVK